MSDVEAEDKETLTIEWFRWSAKNGGGWRHRDLIKVLDSYEAAKARVSELEAKLADRDCDSCIVKAVDDARANTRKAEAERDEAVAALREHVSTEYADEREATQEDWDRHDKAFTNSMAVLAKYPEKTQDGG